MSGGIGVCAAKGFTATGVACGIKAANRLDLALIVSDRPAHAAGMFTTNLVCGAPITVSRSHIASGTARALVANAGNANTCTGEAGERNARDMCALVAEGLGCTPEEVLVASTGVIGRHLPMDRISGGIQQALGSLSVNGGEKASKAIMTTDTVPKTAERRVDIGRTEIVIGGIAKGSGMIAPKLATMLAFITTDACIASDVLHAALTHSVEQTFNRVTVDGDTSTSDMAVVLANGASECSEILPGTDTYAAFSDALTDVCRELAEVIARDGEGATKFVTVSISGAPTTEDAVRAARTVAESPLVKTALFGGDPNWGRIAAAIGRSGVLFRPEQLRIWADDLLLFSNGTPAQFDLQDAEKRFRENVVTIRADLGAGECSADVYTCDMTYDYIRINADYTT